MTRHGDKTGNPIAYLIQGGLESGKLSDEEADGQIRPFIPSL